jgi:hypothetical protein
MLLLLRLLRQLPAPAALTSLLLSLLRALLGAVAAALVSLNRAAEGSAGPNTPGVHTTLYSPMHAAGMRSDPR